MLGRDRGRAARAGHAPTRPTDIGTLQAVAAVGQPLLMERFGAILGAHGLLAGQVLLTPHDFGVRSQYLHARETLRRLLDLGVVPVVNENDTVADDEIRYGDNDRLAALVVAPGRAPTCSCCSPTPPGCSPPIPALDDARVAHRGDRRGRRRARGASPAARARRAGAAAWPASSRRPRSRRGRACAR